MRAVREMNDKQHRKLDRIDKVDTERNPRVVGWLDEKGVGRGPVVRHQGGDKYVVNITGYAKRIN